MRVDYKKPIPLYQQVADIIRSDIESGKIKIGDQLGSHQALSKNYGVSLITIKRALNDLVKEGALYARVGKGTFVQSKPEHKSPPGTKSIGLVLRDLKSPFFSRIVQSVEAYASRKGYNLFISNSSQEIEKEETLIRHFYDIGTSGLIIASMTHEYKASHFLRKINAENYPCIMVSYVKDPDIYFVGTNHEEGGYMATNHLSGIGYKNIGYIDGEIGNVVGELRRIGYMRALHDQGIPVREKYLFHLRNSGEWNDYNSGYEIGELFVKLPERPEAMFVYNDLSALGFEQALLDHGLSVPNDVAIVGFDGIERAQYAPVPLTTVEQPFDQIGSLAVENLIKRIENQPVNTKTVLLPRLVIRESCGVSVKSIVQSRQVGTSTT